MKLLLNFLTRLGQIVLVFTLTFVTPAFINSVVTLNLGKYLELMNDVTYSGAMAFISIIVTFVYCAYIIAENE